MTDKSQIATGHVQLNSPTAYSELVDVSAADHTFADANSRAMSTRAIYVGTGGDLVLQLAGDPDGTTIMLTGVLTGAYLPVRATKVIKVATTAATIVGLW